MLLVYRMRALLLLCLCVAAGVGADCPDRWEEAPGLGCLLFDSETLRSWNAAQVRSLIKRPKLR